MDFYQLTVYALIAGFVLVFWKAAQWTLASTKVARSAESLTPADLQALQEACEGLIGDLRDVADEATARVNLAVQKAEIIVSKLDQSIPLDSILAQVQQPSQAEASEVESLAKVPQVDISRIEDPTLRIYHLADRGHSAEDIASHEGRSPGEVRLILDLRNLQMETPAV